MKSLLRHAPLCALLLLFVAMTGCRHKAPPLVAINVPPPPVIAVEPAPTPTVEPQVPPVAVAQAPLPAKIVPPKRVKKPRIKPVAPSISVVQPTAPAPVKLAGAGAPVPAANVVGALTSGGDDTSAVQMKVTNLLANLQKRLAALAPAAVDQRRDQVVRVRYFCSQADAALHMGDADGAWTLATKAKVLLDDFAK